MRFSQAMSRLQRFGIRRQVTWALPRLLQCAPLVLISMPARWIDEWYVIASKTKNVRLRRIFDAS